MMSTKQSRETVKLVQESFGRDIFKGNFLFDRFYDIFLKCNSIIAKMFKNKDMTR